MRSHSNKGNKQHHHHHQQQQQQQRGSIPSSLEPSLFDEDFSGATFTKPTELWQRFDDYHLLRDTDIQFQCRMNSKNTKTNKYITYHYELYSDRLIRSPTSSSTSAVCSAPPTMRGLPPAAAAATTTTTTTKESSLYEQLLLNSCYLKKLKPLETTNATQKYGIRMHRCDLKTEIFTESLEDFTKFFDEIKRFTLLSNFSKKYKILSKLNTNSSSSYLCNSSSSSTNNISSTNLSSNPNIQTSFTNFNSTSVAAAAASNTSQQQHHTFKCFRYIDSTMYTVRIIDKYSLSTHGRASIVNEVAILRRFDHPSLVRLIEVYEDESNVFLVFELLEPRNDFRTRIPPISLSPASMLSTSSQSSNSATQQYFSFPSSSSSNSYSNNHHRFLDESTIADIMYRLLNGLKHLHARNIIHKDIRLENIYTRSEISFYDVCLADFSSAESLDTPQKLSYEQPSNRTTSSSLSSAKYPRKTIPYASNTNITNDISICYLAPEIQSSLSKTSLSYIGNTSMNNSTPYSTKSDIYALGIVFYFLIFGRLPQPGSTVNIDLAQQQSMNFAKQSQLSSSAFDLMRRMVEKDAKNRPEAAQLVTHTWFISMRNRAAEESSKFKSNHHNHSAGIEHAFSALSTVLENEQISELEFEDDNNILLITYIPKSARNKSNNNNNNMTSTAATSASATADPFDESEILSDDDDESNENMRRIESAGLNWNDHIMKGMSRFFEEEINRESVNEKMRSLNTIEFTKVPSKERHDKLTSQFVQQSTTQDTLEILNNKLSALQVNLQSPEKQLLQSPKQQQQKLQYSPSQHSAQNQVLFSYNNSNNNNSNNHSLHVSPKLNKLNLNIAGFASPSEGYSLQFEGASSASVSISASASLFASATVAMTTATTVTSTVLNSSEPIGSEMLMVSVDEFNLLRSPQIHSQPTPLMTSSNIQDHLDFSIGVGNSSHYYYYN